MIMMKNKFVVLRKHLPQRCAIQRSADELFVKHVSSHLGQNTIDLSEYKTMRCNTIPGHLSLDQHDPVISQRLMEPLGWWEVSQVDVVACDDDCSEYPVSKKRYKKDLRYEVSSSNNGTPLW